MIYDALKHFVYHLAFLKSNQIAHNIWLFTLN